MILSFLFNSCFQFVKRMNGNNAVSSNVFSCYLVALLPIREAYEWKLIKQPQPTSFAVGPCFQFVKRMNGNKNSPPSCPHPSYTCFQFVKRMNGNHFPTALKKGQFFFQIILLPIREAYEWKREGGLSTIPQVSLLPIREAYEWKRCLSHLPARRPQLASNS